jgi:uncharacterized protein YkwD
MARVLLILMLLSIAPVSAQTPAERVLELTNTQRWLNGQLPPLKGESLLQGAAAAHSAAMATRDFMMHCDPDTGTSPFVRMTAAGYFYNAAAENISAGYATPEAAVAGWMASSGHRANLLSTSYREIGIGHALQAGDQANVRFGNGCTVTSSNNGPFGNYWTQKFGRRDSVYPLVIAREAYQTATCSVPVYLYGAGWAQEMRFSPDAQQWTAWQAFASNSNQTLRGAMGAASTLHAQLRNGGSVRSAQDSIRLAVDCNPGAPGSFFRDGFE